MKRIRMDDENVHWTEGKNTKTPLARGRERLREGTTSDRLMLCVHTAVAQQFIICS